MLLIAFLLTKFVYQFVEEPAPAPRAHDLVAILPGKEVSSPVRPLANNDTILAGNLPPPSPAAQQLSRQPTAPRFSAPDPSALEPAPNPPSPQAKPPPPQLPLPYLMANSASQPSHQSPSRAQLSPQKRRPANTTRMVHGQQIGSRRSTATGMSTKRLTKLLEEEMQKDEQMRRATEEAIEQANFQSEPNPEIGNDAPKPPSVQATQVPPQQHTANLTVLPASQPACQSPRRSPSNKDLIFRNAALSPSSQQANQPPPCQPSVISRVIPASQRSFQLPRRDQSTLNQSPPRRNNPSPVPGLKTTGLDPSDLDTDKCAQELYAEDEQLLRAIEMSRAEEVERQQLLPQGMTNVWMMNWFGNEKFIIGDRTPDELFHELSYNIVNQIPDFKQFVVLFGEAIQHISNATITQCFAHPLHVIQIKRWFHCCMMLDVDAPRVGVVQASLAPMHPSFLPNPEPNHPNVPELPQPTPVAKNLSNRREEEEDLHLLKSVNDGHRYLSSGAPCQPSVTRAEAPQVDPVEYK